MTDVFKRNFKYIDDLYTNIEKEMKLQEKNEWDDMQVLAYLNELHEMRGELYVITDICYEDERGPFKVKADGINEFVKEFQVQYGESFYSTDVVIVNFEEKLIWVFFHEGMCWLSKE